MIALKDPVVTVYPNREQMLALIRARATADRADQTKERRSAAPDTPLPPAPTCIPLL